MHAVILAAGFGRRMGDLSRMPKALLPFGRGCVLDHVVSTMWVPGVSTVQVVHNNGVIHWRDDKAKMHDSDWPKMFRAWRKGLMAWVPESGRNREPPYIRLQNNGVHSEENRRGALGDFAWLIKSHMRRDKIERGILVACCDNIFPRVYFKSLCTRGTTAITCRHEDDLHQTVIDGEPSRVHVNDKKRVTHCSTPYAVSISPWRFCGPFFLAESNVDFLLDWVGYRERSDTPTDDMGQFFTDLAEDKKVRAVCKRDGAQYWDCGTVDGYEHAKRMSVTEGVKDILEMKKAEMRAAR